MAWKKKEACIWHAFKALDIQGTGTVDKSRLKVLTHNVANSLGLQKVEERMDEFTNNKLVSFEDYITFFRGEVELNLGDKSKRTSMVEAMNKIDEICWLVCRMSYTKRDCPRLNPDLVYKLWCIFNLVSEVDDAGTAIFPVVMDYEEVSHLLDTLYKSHGVPFDTETFEKDYSKELPVFSFEQLLNLLENHYCGPAVGMLDLTGINSAISDLYDELVREILKKGYMNKRGSGKTMTGWKERWFSLSIKDLSYFTNREETNKRGDIHIAAVVRVEAVEEKGTQKNVRFNIVCPGRTYEINAPDCRTRSEWMAVIKLARELNETPWDYPPVKARDKRRELREARRRKSREDAEMMERQQRELDAIRKAKEEMEEKMRMEAKRRAEELEEEKRKREEAIKAKEEMEQEMRLKEEELRRELERSKQNLDDQKQTWLDEEERFKEDAKRLRDEMAETERMHQAQAEKSQEMLEAEQKERAELEESLRLREEALEADKKRLQELEELQKELETLLEEERRAKMDEELVRTAQARVLQEELEQKEELLRVKQEMEAAMLEEQRRREALERLKQSQEEELIRGQKQVEELAAIKQQQEDMLQEEQHKLRLLEEAKMKHEELLREGEQKLQDLTKEKADMQEEYQDAMTKLKEAEKAKDAMQKNLVKKEQQKPFVVVGLARPIQPRAKPLDSHRGVGVFTEAEFDIIKQKRLEKHKVSPPESKTASQSSLPDMASSDPHSNAPPPVPPKRRSKKSVDINANIEEKSTVQSDEETPKLVNGDAGNKPPSSELKEGDISQDSYDKQIPSETADPVSPGTNELEDSNNVGLNLSSAGVHSKTDSEHGPNHQDTEPLPESPAQEKHFDVSNVSSSNVETRSETEASVETGAVTSAETGTSIETGTEASIETGTEGSIETGTETRIETVSGADTERTAEPDEETTNESSSRQRMTHLTTEDNPETS